MGISFYGVAKGAYTRVVKGAIERDELIRGWAYTPDLRSLTLTEGIPKQKLFLTKEVYTVV